MVLGEIIQTLWNAIQGNTKITTSSELKDSVTSQDTGALGADLPQGIQFLQFRDDKIARGAQHMHMLTSPQNEDLIEDFIPTHIPIIAHDKVRKKQHTPRNKRKLKKRLQKMQN